MRSEYLPLALLVLCLGVACAPRAAPPSAPPSPAAAPTALPASYPEIAAIDTSGARSFDPALAETGAIRYTLTAPALVRLRIVDKGTPGIILRTLLDWAPREAGPHSETWDGRDAHGETIDPRAVSFVLASEPRPELLDATQSAALASLRHPEHKHFLHARDRCADLTVHLEAPTAGAFVSGAAEIVATVEGRLGMPEGEYHVVVYLDGRTAWDGRVAEPRLVRAFDAANLVEGEHDLAVTFNDLRDHAGSARLCFVVRHP
mgnify:CR=1 FL=1